MHNKIKKNGILFFIAYMFFITSFLTGCGYEDHFNDDKQKNDKILLSVKLNKLSSHARKLIDIDTLFKITVTLDDTLTKEMEIDYEMGTANVFVPRLSAGTHTFAVRIFTEQFILAEQKTTDIIEPGFNLVSISRFNTGFDDDNDGFSNLAELLSGFNPDSADSTPLFDLPPIISVSSGGLSENDRISIYSGVGEFTSGQQSRSGTVKGKVKMFSFFQ